MRTFSYNKVVASMAAVALLAGYGLWVGMAQDGSSDRDPDRPTASATAALESESPTQDPKAAKRDDRPAQKVKARDGVKGGAGATDKPDDPTTDETADESDDSSGDLSDDEVTVTLGTGETVDTEVVQTEAPVPLDSVGDFGTGLTVRLSDVAAVQAEAKAPGEIAGPAVQVTVRADNGDDSPVSLDGVVVFVSYGEDRVPASQFGSSSDPLTGDLAAGSARSGTYLYAVPPESRGDVRVEISYTGSAPTVAFEGSLDG